ncbi:MAG: hypothetical protein WC876_00715 [Candidatus Thermoplasmatota archaeon]|jgi:hypothetical protein
MPLRVLVALLLAAGALAGCATTNSGVMTSQEAIAAARRLEPEGRLMGAFGVEGQLPARDVPHLDFRHDGLDDGILGDGRLSSWVVGFVVGETYVEHRIYADGREPESAAYELSSAAIDQQVFMAIGQPMDSDEAARSAAPVLGPALPEARGYLYTYSLVELATPSALVMDGELLADDVGRFVHANGWAITAIGADGDGNAIAAVADLDTVNGTLAGPRQFRLVRQTQAFSGQMILYEPDGPEALAPPPHVVTFDLPSDATRILGNLSVRPHDALYPYGGTVRLRILGPDGNAALDQDDARDVPVALEQDLTAGAWSIELSRSQPSPGGNIFLTGWLTTTHAVPL